MIKILTLDGTEIGTTYCGAWHPAAGGLGCAPHRETAQDLRRMFGAGLPAGTWWLGKDGSIQLSGVTVGRWQDAES